MRLLQIIYKYLFYFLSYLNNDHISNLQNEKLKNKFEIPHKQFKLYQFEKKK